MNLYPSHIKQIQTLLTSIVNEELTPIMDKFELQNNAMVEMQRMQDELLEENSELHVRLQCRDLEIETLKLEMKTYETLAELVRREKQSKYDFDIRGNAVDNWCVQNGFHKERQ